MKTIIALFAFVAVASAQSEGWCRCAAFITYEHTEALVHEFPEIPLDSCDDANLCKNKCVNELNEQSFNGDLWHMTDQGVTIGQMICTELAHHFHPFLVDHKVYGYYEVCGGAWQYSGVESETELCCTGGQQHHCTA